MKTPRSPLEPDLPLDLLCEESPETEAENPTEAPSVPRGEDLYRPRDVTPKALRGRGVRILRLFTGWAVSPYTRGYAARYRWRVQVPWGVNGWSPRGTFPKLRKAVEVAWSLSS